MISPSDFTAQMKRLRNCFGDNAFPFEREKRLWEFVENKDAAWFKKACDYFIDDFKFAPTVSNFRENYHSSVGRDWNYDNDILKRELHQGHTRSKEEIKALIDKALGKK